MEVIKIADAQEHLCSPEIIKILQQKKYIDENTTHVRHEAVIQFLESKDIYIYVHHGPFSSFPRQCSFQIVTNDNHEYDIHVYANRYKAIEAALLQVLNKIA